MKKGKALRRILIFLVLAGLLSGGAWLYVDSSKEPPIEYITAAAKRGDMRSVILATGKVQAVSMISVGTQISGTLKELYVDYNSVVRKGQLIAIIDPEPHEAGLEQARASLLAIEADVAEAEANLKHSRDKLRRSQELYSKDLIARSELDADETSLQTSKARLSSARARVTAQLAAVKNAKLQLDYTRIYSPVDGVVVTKNVNVGQTVAASFNTPTIAEIAEDLSRMQVEVNIDEADIGSVSKGQAVEFNVDAFPERKFSGTVTQIRLSPTTENNVISYKAIVSFLNEQIEGHNLIPGMTANVTLIVEEKAGVVKVPNASLRFRPLTDEKNASTPASGGPGMRRRGGGGGDETAEDEGFSRKPAVYGLKDGVPLKIEVETGITDGKDTEITSGLEPGTEIIIGIDIPIE
ncbi:MAG: efflux RND transporter periplasmic adaptor subunit [Synergistaceae bacterium]|jgi:HlyD family secretion protein|nr:efflux RND transporter periplasmic adaptor subunit [Synergistaceae bacterium]